MAQSEQKRCFNAGKIGFCHSKSEVQTKETKKGRDLHLGLLYILILGTYSKFARKNNFLAWCLLSAALLDCWPQVCHVKITFTILPTNCFVCTTKKWMKCVTVVNWIPLRIHVHSRNTKAHLKTSLIKSVKSSLSVASYSWLIKFVKVGLGIFDFCAISRRLISKTPISSPNFSCGHDLRNALWAAGQ